MRRTIEEPAQKSIATGICGELQLLDSIHSILPITTYEPVTSLTLAFPTIHFPSYSGLLTPMPMPEPLPLELLRFASISSSVVLNSCTDNAVLPRRW